MMATIVVRSTPMLLGDLLLRGRLEAVDRQQHPEIARVDVERRQRLDMQLRHQPLRMLEQIGQPPARQRLWFPACRHPILSSIARLIVSYH